MATSLAVAKNPLFYYEPIVIKLRGVVQIKTLPGPPNYDDIKKGDEPETYGYLILKHPIDVDLKPGVSDESGGFIVHATASNCPKIAVQSSAACHIFRIISYLSAPY